MSGDTLSGVLRPDLIEEFRRGGDLRTQWVGEPSTEAMALVAERTGLHLSVARLVLAVGGYRNDEESIDFYVEMLGSVPSGPAGANLVRAWFLDCWDVPRIGLAAGLGDLAMAPAAAKIRSLVKDSMEAAVAPKAWRSARAELASIGGDAPYVEPVLAMAWDLDTVPGASADVYFGWWSALDKASRAELGWTAQDNERLAPLTEEFNGRAVAEIGMPTKEDTGWMQRFQDNVESYWAERPDLAEFKARYQIVQQRASEDYLAVIAAARSTLLSRAKAMASTVTA